MTIADRSCPDCGAQVGAIHKQGCDVERCSVCLGQHLMCGHEEHDPMRARWTGEWPGITACRELGWFNAEGRPDLNRWTYFIMRVAKGDL